MNFDLYNKNLLQEKVKTLADSLISRNNTTGKYYLALSDKITKLESNFDLITIVDEILTSSSKIQDLAGFNYKEDLILEEIFKISNSIRINKDNGL